MSTRRVSAFAAAVRACDEGVTLQRSSTFAAFEDALHLAPPTRAHVGARTT